MSKDTTRRTNLSAGLIKPTSRTQALCCVCGTVRWTTNRGGYAEPEFRAIGAPGRQGDRCIVERKCATCRAITMHAYLRNDAQRDYFERFQPSGSALDAVLQDLARHDVEINTEDEWLSTADGGMWSGLLQRWLLPDAMPWEFRLKPGLPMFRRVETAQRALTWLTTARRPDVTLHVIPADEDYEERLGVSFGFR